EVLDVPGKPLDRGRLQRQPDDRRGPAQQLLENRVGGGLAVAVEGTGHPQDGRVLCRGLDASDLLSRPLLIEAEALVVLATEEFRRVGDAQVRLHPDTE